MGCWLNLWGARLADGMLSSYRDACIVFGVTRPGIHARSAINLCSFLHTRGHQSAPFFPASFILFVSVVFGASTLAPFLPPGSPLAPSGYPPVNPRLPRSLLYSCHFAFSSHSVFLSPSVPLSISFALFPPLLLPFRSLLSFHLSVTVSHFIRSLSPSRSHAF